MHDSEEFQRQTIKAITDLEKTFSQTLSRQLALGAMVRSMLNLAPLEALPALLEEFESEVDHQAALLHPDFQRPEFWQEWSDAIEARRKQLQQIRDKEKGAA